MLQHTIFYHVQSNRIGSFALHFNQRIEIIKIPKIQFTLFLINENLISYSNSSSAGSYGNGSASSYGPSILSANSKTIKHTNELFTQFYIYASVYFHKHECRFSASKMLFLQNQLHILPHTFLEVFSANAIFSWKSSLFIEAYIHLSSFIFYKTISFLKVRNWQSHFSTLSIKYS